MTASGLAALFCQAAASNTQAASATMVALDLLLAIAVNPEQHSGAHDGRPPGLYL
jgi:hypothetical protein